MGVVLQATPDSEHTPHRGRSLSQRSLRLLHSSHAEPGFCRERGGVVVVSPVREYDVSIIDSLSAASTLSPQSYLRAAGPRQIGA